MVNRGYFLSSNGGRPIRRYRAHAGAFRGAEGSLQSSHSSGRVDVPDMRRRVMKRAGGDVVMALWREALCGVGAVIGCSPVYEDPLAFLFCANGLYDSCVGRNGSDI